MIPATVSSSGRKPRVGPYCSTDPSLPASNSRTISWSSCHGNVSGAGYPGAKDTMSRFCASTVPIRRIADSCIIAAERERDAS
jgi:hypothetical protein